MSDLTKQTKNAEIDAFLEAAKKVPAPHQAGRGRLIFSLDATMSRQPTWDMACTIQGEMFEATREIGGLDVQLVFFRGFHECKAGKWQPDAKGLADQMSKIDCRAGQTQIGRVLAHIKKQAQAGKVGAAIYIGDAFEEDIDKVCHTAGEIGLLGTPVFVFQEGGDPIARRGFQEIARLTGGAWHRFDPNSAHLLKSLLSAVAVYATGGVSALERLEKSGRREPAALLQQMRGSQRGRS